MFVSPTRRVIVANEPRWLRHMLARVLDKVAGLQACAVAPEQARDGAWPGGKHADWIILTLSSDGELPSEAAALTTEHPSLGIVGIAGDGGCVRLQRTGFVSRAMRDLSLEELAAVLRPGAFGHSLGEAA